MRHVRYRYTLNARETDKLRHCRWQVVGRSQEDNVQGQWRDGDSRMEHIRELRRS